MKRVVSLLTILFVALSFSACKKQAEKESTSSEAPKSNIAGYAIDGEIDTLKIKLGDSPEEVKQYYNADSSSAGTSSVDSAASAASDVSSVAEPTDGIDKLYISGTDLIKMQVDTAQFYYRAADEDKGISMIVQLADAYSLSPQISTIDDVRSMVGKPKSESVPTAEELFFIPDNPDNCYRLTYYFSRYRVDFYFINELLLGVTICNPEVWEAGTQSSTATSSTAS